MDGLYRPAREAESEPVEFEWGRIIWLANQALTDCPDISVCRVVIQVGKTNPDHVHPNSREVLYVLVGTVRRTIGEDALIMHAGDTCIVPAGVRHGVANIGDSQADLMVAFSSGTFITNS